MRVFQFSELKNAPLIVDAIYKGGNRGNMGDEPISKLLPKTANQSGFRITYRNDNRKLPAYVTIYTTMDELEWPDYLDVENGVFRYYGDNRKPGKELHNTNKKGNLLLKNIFQWLNEQGDSIKKIPPFLIFEKASEGRDVRFLGLAAPGNINIPPDRDLIAFWRSLGNQRFQNYEAYFTILDVKNETISKKWLIALIEDHVNSLNLAPKCWQKFIEQGRSGIKPLRASKITMLRKKDEQLPNKLEEIETIQAIRDYYSENPFGFEKCAVAIIRMMDPNFYDFDLTRPWRDGGRDAVGKYRIGLDTHSLYIDCALEAKCYSAQISVGVKQMSRLISRIKYRQFGIMVTTSYINSQAYKEFLEDGHPILIICAKDIVEVLRRNGIGAASIRAWLSTLRD